MEILTRPPRLRRLPDWEARLCAFINAARHESLDWGAFDCVVGLVSGAVEAITGEDLSASVRGSYSTQTGAMKALREMGHDSDDLILALRSLMDTYLRPAASHRKRRGNIVLMQTQAGAGFGVRFGRDIFALDVAGGLRAFRPDVVVAEWEVG